MTAPLRAESGAPTQSALILELKALVERAENEAAGTRGAAARLDQAARRWSLGICAPAEVVRLVGELRAPSRTTRARAELLDRVTMVAVTAVAERQVREALTDPLSGLATRARMEEEAQLLVAMSLREGTPLAAVVLDVDGLKRLNDEQGHAAGDAAIAEVGRAVRAHARRTDRAFRWGGDEFVLLMPSTTEHGARLVVERIQDSCGTATTAGVAMHHGTADPVDIVAWLGAADADLYRRRRAIRSIPTQRPAAARRVSPALALGVAALAVTTGGLGASGLAGAVGGHHRAVAPHVVAAPAVGSGEVAGAHDADVSGTKHLPSARPAVAKPTAHLPTSGVTPPLQLPPLPRLPIDVPVVHVPTPDLPLTPPVELPDELPVVPAAPAGPVALVRQVLSTVDLLVTRLL
ncbi:MAG TPA: GGDEF domain-containing protein [Mycobacteriales bacterium]|nr:GGDEF domain-containing protein [Mycobacteriales bacterium]